VAGPLLKGYWEASRAPRYSLLFALPLLVGYEVLAAALSRVDGGIRNGADVILKGLFLAAAGRAGPLIFEVCLIGGSVWLIARDLRAHGRRLRGGVFAGMLAEAVGLALMFGIVVGGITARLLRALALAAPAQVEALGFPTRLMVALGAGLYEELLFRVVLVAALAWLARHVFRWRPWVAGTWSVVIGAVAFSAFHYIGPLGDPLRLDTFLFRAVAGVFFSALYLMRGFGITAWTHALYDVFLLLGRG